MSGAAKPSVLVQALYRREYSAWILTGVTLGVVEGATAAILVKQVYGGVASATAVNLAVAFVSGAPSMSNLSSFLWANHAMGRARTQLMTTLLALFGVAVGLVGLAPRSAGGLWLTVLAVIVARIVWAGILTVRASVWTANYPRAVLARVTGRLVVACSLGITGAALLAGLAVDRDADLSRLLYGVAMVCGLLAAWRYRQTRVRREFVLRSAEQAAPGTRVFSLAAFREVLRDDPTYRRYMGWLGLYGAGNLMVAGQLVVIYSDTLGLSGLEQVLMLAVVPLLSIPLFTPWWARLFDSRHAIEYRALQCWALIAAILVLLPGVFAGWQPLLWLGALLLGAASAGANLGWNLAHSDFASAARLQQYMGVNVTLTGLRGLTAPPLGVLACTALDQWRPGSGRYALFIPLSMVVAGSVGFHHLKRHTHGRRRQ
ncbi:MAG: hypothetical protein RL026_2609 [Pseudomonadota bacterium]|jgi:MFS family permease